MGVVLGAVGCGNTAELCLPAGPVARARQTLPRRPTVRLLRRRQGIFKVLACICAQRENSIFSEISVLGKA